MRRLRSDNALRLFRRSCLHSVEQAVYAVLFSNLLVTTAVVPNQTDALDDEVISEPATIMSVQAIVDRYRLRSGLYQRFHSCGLFIFDLFADHFDGFVAIGFDPLPIGVG